MGRGAGAALERALITWMLNINTTVFGYTEVLPPYVVTSAALVGTGQLPKFAEDLFHIEGTDGKAAQEQQSPALGKLMPPFLDVRCDCIQGKQLTGQ